jgi:hypothetical protein
MQYFAKLVLAVALRASQESRSCSGITRAEAVRANRSGFLLARSEGNGQDQLRMWSGSEGKEKKDEHNNSPHASHSLIKI